MRARPHGRQRVRVDAGRIRPPAGFTLIELMVAVAVVAILAAIAIPSYSAYVVRGKRSGAKTALLQAAQAMERAYTQSGCYTLTDAPCTGANVTPQTSAADYSVALQVQTAQAYTLAATPCGAPGAGAAACGGSTFVDPECGVLTLDNTGAKGALGGAAAAPVAQQCWNR
jgi:type IV pilus assembly protein PilE